MPVLTHLRSTSNGEVLGTVDTCTVATPTGIQTWVKDGAPGFIGHFDQWFLGRWQSQEEAWLFAPEQGTSAIPTAETYDILDYYWGERAQLVMDRSLDWQCVTCSNEMDHFHCAICWATISFHDQCWSSAGIDRVCPKCYREFVTRRDLSFIPIR